MSIKISVSGYCKMYDDNRAIPVTYAFVRKFSQSEAEYLLDRNACPDAVNCDYFDHCEIYNNLDPVIIV